MTPGRVAAALAVQVPPPLSRVDLGVRLGRRPAAVRGRSGPAGSVLLVGFLSASVPVGRGL
ncbi:hypothetical protein ACIRVF_30390 [Kitasatospora sp. NPDC101157]|uniref:hypothetical protein n=1 Tax=Kitasatospora sp. NPDC101157 TaxID=3364098 RepID=UPI00382D5397